MAQFLDIAQKKVFGDLTGAKPRRKDAPARLVLHTTETKGLPNYASPPHFTIGVGHPGSIPSLEDGQVKIWQHVSLDRTAYALAHPKKTEETNHMGSHCIQIEMITYVGDIPKAHIVGNKGKLPASLMKAAAELVREIIGVVPEIPLKAPEPNKWSSRGSAGTKAKQRMTPAEWRAFSGICGHEHVPANKHWDPGALDITRFIELVSGGAAPAAVAAAVSPAPAPPSMSGWPKVLHLNDRDKKVVVVRGILQALGFGNLADGDLYNAEVESAVREMQKDFDIGRDGKWGPESHKMALAQLEIALARADIKP